MLLGYTHGNFCVLCWENIDAILRVHRSRRANIPSLQNNMTIARQSLNS